MAFADYWRYADGDQLQLEVTILFARPVENGRGVEGDIRVRSDRSSAINGDARLAHEIPPNQQQNPWHVPCSLVVQGWMRGAAR